MRSLPELSRATGLPVTTILRLRREHPDRLPSVQVGAVQLFPEGVIAEIKALIETETHAPKSPAPRRDALFTLARRRHEIETDGAPSPAPLEVSAPPFEPSPPKTARKASARRSPAPPLSPAPATDPEDLASRLRSLERAQRRLTKELADMIQQVRRPCVGRLVLP